MQYPEFIKPFDGRVADFSPQKLAASRRQLRTIGLDTLLAYHQWVRYDTFGQSPYVLPRLTLLPDDPRNKQKAEVQQIFRPMPLTVVRIVIRSEGGTTGIIQYTGDGEENVRRYDIPNLEEMIERRQKAEKAEELSKHFQQEAEKRDLERQRGVNDGLTGYEELTMLARHLQHMHPIVIDNYPSNI